MNLVNFSNSLQVKFSHLTLREQWLSVLVALVGVYFLFDTWVLTPQGIRHQVLVSQQQVAQAQLDVIHAQTLALDQGNEGRAMLTLRQAEHEQLKKQIAVLDAISGGVKPDAIRIGTLVKEVLKSQYPKVTLDALKTLPVKSLMAAPKNGSTSASQTTIYKHGIDIEVRGSYLDLLAYVKTLEASSQTLFWSDAKLAALKYPEATLRLTIFILSDQPNLGLS
jgi:MSHA biogenesis protein MshJ